MFPGNKDTLLAIPLQRNQDIREELLKFHKRYYSSNVMALTVLGKGFYCYSFSSSYINFVPVEWVLAFSCLVICVYYLISLVIFAKGGDAVCLLLCFLFCGLLQKLLFDS